MLFKDDFTPPPGAEERLNRFYEVLTDYNEKVNLTSITGREDFFTKHIWDSVAGQKYFAAGANAVEVGSGGGFPSLPLKICRSDLKFTLIESVAKKCAFLRYAAEELGLSDVKVVNMRAEEAGRGDLREKFDVCCARAVARLNTLLEYCAPLVKVGGLFVAYKGEAGEEIEEANHAEKVLGMQLVSAEKYNLPGDAGARTLAVYKKTAPTPARYPRGQGKERKQPL